MGGLKDAKAIRYNENVENTKRWMNEKKTFILCV